MLIKRFNEKSFKFNQNSKSHLVIFCLSSSLDWTYHENNSIPLDVYERIRGPRRKTYDLLLDRYDRSEMLVEDWQVSRVEIAQAIREIFKTKNRRRTTVQNCMSNKSQKLDLFLESARRKLKRTLLFQKKTSTRVEDMLRQAELAALHMARIVSADNADNVDNECNFPPDTNPIHPLFGWDEDENEEATYEEQQAHSQRNYVVASPA